MKRSMMWSVLLALLIALFGVNMSARAGGAHVIFAASLTPGLFPTESEAGFVKGSVKVYADRTVEFTIVGAQPNETYEAYGGILLAYTTDDIISWAPVAAGGSQTLQLTTDARGKGTATGWLGVPEHDAYVVFALDDADNEENTYKPNRYVTGVRFQ